MLPPVGLLASVPIVQSECLCTTYALTGTVVVFFPHKSAAKIRHPDVQPDYNEPLHVTPQPTNTNILPLLVMYYH